MTSSRFTEIAHDLRERIALGEFGTSGSIDSEAELGRRYAVSRPTVRKALELLRSQGLVGPRQGAGWFVTGSAFHQRLALGTFRHASSAVAEAGKAVRRRVVDFGYRTAPPALAASLGLTATPPSGPAASTGAPGTIGATGTTEVLFARSVRTVEDDALDVVREWVRPDVAGAVSRDDATDPGIWQTLARHGHPIATVRQTITAGAATDTDAELLGVEPGTPLLLVRRLATGTDGRPLAMSDHRYLAHRFALEVEFNSGPGPTADEPPGLRQVHPHPLPTHATTTAMTTTTATTGTTSTTSEEHTA